MMQILDKAIADIRAWWVTPAPGLPAPRARLVRSTELSWFADDEGIEVSSTYAPEEQNAARPIIEHGVDSGNFDVLFVPVTAAGFVGAFDVNGDGVSLVSRCLDANGNLVESSQSARLYVRVNSERAIGLPFSYLTDQNGAQKSDLLSLTARVQRVWIYCGLPTQDAAQSVVILAFTKGISISGLFGSAGLAGAVPASPSAATSASVGVQAAAPSAPPSGGGGTQGGGGTYGGGGITGGGGTQRPSNL
jgi:hypothetical protein